MSGRVIQFRRHKRPADAGRRVRLIERRARRDYVVAVGSLDFVLSMARLVGAIESESKGGCVLLADFVIAYDETTNSGVGYVDRSYCSGHEKKIRQADDKNNRD